MELTTSQLREAIDALRARELELSDEVEALSRELDANRQERDLLIALVRLRGGDTFSPAEGSKRSFEDRVAALIHERGRPLHLNEIIEGLKAEGFPIPGAGTQANVVSRLSRDDRFERVRRGFYSLLSEETSK